MLKRPSSECGASRFGLLYMRLLLTLLPHIAPENARAAPMTVLMSGKRFQATISTSQPLFPRFHAHLKALRALALSSREAHFNASTPYSVYRRTISARDKFFPHGLDVGRFAYRHSSRNATPTPIRTNGQTQEVPTRKVTTPGSRNTKPAIRNMGTVIAQ